jgi:nucleoside-diphosphate-sugar epimerase
VPRLLERGDQVRVLARKPESACALQNRGAEVVAGDLTQPGTLASSVNGVDAVIHLAAFFRGATEEETIAVNARGTAALAESALKAGVSRFVFASTNLVYGHGAARPAREDDELAAASAYPNSKIAAERSLLELHKTGGLGLRVVRLAFVYGEGDPHLKEGMMWFNKWHPDKRIHLVHHADAAQAIMLALDTPGIDGRIYNAADAEPVTAAEIIPLVGENIAADAYDRPLEHPWDSIVDITKISSELGYEPRFPTLRSASEAGVL